MKIFLTLVALFGWMCIPLDAGKAGVESGTIVKEIKFNGAVWDNLTSEGKSEILRRDFFAGQALAGIIANEGPYHLSKAEGSILALAFYWADLMEKQRNK